MDAGQEFDIRAIAPSDQRRMEAGIFNYGNDMDITNNPFEVTGLERLVEPQAALITGTGRSASRSTVSGSKAVLVSEGML